MMKDLIRKMPIRDIDKLRYDLSIFKSRSWSGRMADDRFFANVFISEAIVSLNNSLDLFEKGYFDCAFYCLRSSLDLSTTVSYLHDAPEEDRQDNYIKWVRKQGWFPSRSEMMKSMEKYGMFCSDMKEKMELVFGDDGLIKRTNRDLNKHVHKQGYDEFYVMRNHPLDHVKYDDQKFIDEFIRLFKDTVMIVAVMRLLIDPFPILLLDPEINSRCPELEEPYDEDFVSDCLSEDIISCFKETRIYREAYDQFIGRESCSEAILNVKRYWIYDRHEESTIREQIHLLDSQEVWLAELIFSSPKVLKITDGCGMLLAQTEVQVPDWGTSGFFEYCRNGEINIPYKGRYISSFNCFEDGRERRYYFDHSEPFDQPEIAHIMDYIIKKRFLVMMYYILCGYRICQRAI